MTTTRYALDQFRIAFFDLDGTLLDSRGEVTPRSIEAVRTLRNAGLRIAFATGRSSFGSHAAAGVLDVDDYCAFFSGGLIQNPKNGQVLFEATLSAHELERIVQICRDSKIYAELYTSDDYFIEMPGDIADRHSVYMGKYPKVCDLLECSRSGLPFLKATLVACGDSQNIGLDLMREELRHLHFAIAPGARDPDLFFANITSAEATRENAFNVIMNHHGFSPAQAMSFGDASSDIPFLRMSGLGVAMGNAEASVKDAADYVTASVDEDGIAEAIARLF